MTSNHPGAGEDAPAAEVHTVVPGDHLFRLARERGFRTARPLALEPANQSLLAKRVNPATLAEGDVVTIPALEPKQASGATDRFNTFTLLDSGLLLNLRLQDTDQQPLARRAYRLVVAEHDPAGGFTVADPIDDLTSEQGAIAKAIPDFAIEGELTIHATGDPASAVVGTIKILIGVLESANTIRGQQARLNNMGYFAGFSEKDLDQLHWAIEEFQADHGIKATGAIGDADTFNRIAHEHGDLLKSERVP